MARTKQTARNYTDRNGIFFQSQLNTRYQMLIDIRKNFDELESQCKSTTENKDLQEKLVHITSLFDSLTNDKNKVDEMASQQSPPLSARFWQEQYKKLNERIEEIQFEIYDAKCIRDKRPRPVKETKSEEPETKSRRESPRKKPRVDYNEKK